MSNKKKNFETLDSLGMIGLIIDEASEAVNDKSRTILNSPISDVLIAAGALGAGAAVDIAAISLIAGRHFGKLGMPAILHALKVIGVGNAKRGLLFLAIPAALLLGGVNAIAKAVNRNKLEQAKERLLQLAVEKLAAVLRAQAEEIDANKLRADELGRLNALLTECIHKLREDLSDVSLLEVNLCVITL